ncbi:MAG: family 10 glycosylhydrolase [bacterium]|nr:family 10 glycosylhydrolase [bacterium]
MDYPLLAESMSYTRHGNNKTTSNQSTASKNESLAQHRTRTRAIWVWETTVAHEGVENVVNRLAQYKFNKIIVLVKGNSGEVAFKTSSSHTTVGKQDILQELTSACHKKDIEIHAWFMFHGDKRWVDNHPGEAIYKAGDTANWAAGPVPAKNEKVCPLAPGYRNYFKSLISDLLDNYAVDGIHLDGIRYTHIMYCFCPRHQQKAKELGINLDHIRKIVYKSIAEKNIQRGTFVEAYTNGDPDIVKWVKFRQDEITSMTQEIKEIIHKKKPNVNLSAALMPEGGEADDAFALCYYGQNYWQLGTYLDFICPMSYEGSFGKKSDWVIDIAKRTALRTGKPVYPGIQGFTAEGTNKPFTATDFATTLQAIYQHNLNGFTIFRYGSMTDEMWIALDKFNTTVDKQ